MKRTVQILTIILLVIGFSLSMSALAWSITTREMLYLPLWLITFIGLIITFTRSKAGYYILLTSSILWLLQMAETFGWFLTFELDNLALWGVVALPIAIAILTAVLNSKILFQGLRRLQIGLYALAIIIPLTGFISYADKTHMKNIFSEYYKVENEKYKVIFRAGPADTRYFEMVIESDELRELVKEKATFVAGHHYFPNSKIRVRMTFDKIKEVELYELNSYELKEPIRWDIAELKGQTEFLK